MSTTEVSSTRRHGRRARELNADDARTSGRRVTGELALFARRTPVSLPPADAPLPSSTRFDLTALAVVEREHAPQPSTPSLGQASDHAPASPRSEQQRSEASPGGRSHALPRASAPVAIPGEDSDPAAFDSIAKRGSWFSSMLGRGRKTREGETPEPSAPEALASQPESIDPEKTEPESTGHEVTAHEPAAGPAQNPDSATPVDAAPITHEQSHPDSSDQHQGAQATQHDDPLSGAQPDTSGPAALDHSAHDAPREMHDAPSETSQPLSEHAADESAQEPGAEADVATTSLAERLEQAPAQTADELADDTEPVTQDAPDPWTSGEHPEQALALEQRSNPDFGEWYEVGDLPAEVAPDPRPAPRFDGKVLNKPSRSATGAGGWVTWAIVALVLMLVIVLFAAGLFSSNLPWVQAGVLHPLLDSAMTPTLGGTLT